MDLYAHRTSSLRYNRPAKRPNLSLDYWPCHRRSSICGPRDLYYDQSDESFLRASSPGYCHTNLSFYSRMSHSLSRISETFSHLPRSFSSHMPEDYGYFPSDYSRYTSKNYGNHGGCHRYDYDSSSPAKSTRNYDYSFSYHSPYTENDSYQYDESYQNSPVCSYYPDIPKASHTFPRDSSRSLREFGADFKYERRNSNEAVFFTRNQKEPVPSGKHFEEYSVHLHSPRKKMEVENLPNDINTSNGVLTYPEPIQNPTRIQKPRMAAKFVYLKQPNQQHCTQILATLAVSIGPLCAGLGKGYSSPALASMADLSAQGHHFPISKDQGSWVASLSLLGAFFGSLPAGMAIRWGRKKVLCFITIPFTLSWILTVLSTNVYMLYAASFLGGACSAVVAVVTPVYISEIAHPDIRGCLCSLAKLSSNIGMLLSYLLGAFLNWRQLATVTAFAPACLLTATLFIPETPSFLLYRGRDTEAESSLQWLRGNNTDVAREMTIMKANISALRREQTADTSPPFAPREIIRPLFITCGLMVFQKFSGANAFNFYAVPILSETFVGLNPYRAAVVVAFVQICAGMASSALVDTVGRRPLLVFSNMLMAAALAAFGVYVYLKGLDHEEDAIAKQQWRESDWVPLFCILIIEIAFALGVSPISWLYIGELFPLKHRGYGALAASASYACSFASVKTFVDFQQWLGLYGTFFFYANVATLALVFTLFFVPETKGKSLQEMQSVEEQKPTLI